LPKTQTKVTEGSSKLTDFGNSSPAYMKAYLPEFELISIVLFSSTVKLTVVPESFGSPIVILPVRQHFLLVESIAKTL
jgi:hypothetical protein